MKIFKNRGDIYISKSNYKSSTEERILLILLALIIVFTTIFAIILNTKYSSVKEFFAGDEVTTEAVGVNPEDNLPQIRGKRNFLIFETDSNKKIIHYIFLVQADRDNLSYKICTLSPKTVIDSVSIADIYTSGGGAALQTKLTAFLGIDIDYYADFDKDDFIAFINKLGTFVYPSDESVKFNDSVNNEDTYSVRLNKGEENITGNSLSGILRYYSNDGYKLEKANQVIIYALSGLFNEKNFDDSQSLFRLFINSSKTNITVRDFQDNIDAVEVFCKKNTDISVYTANAEYDENNVIVPESAKQIKSLLAE